MDGQVSSPVVGEGEPGLDMLQLADRAGFPSAGIHLLAHLQMLSNVSAGRTDRGERVTCDKAYVAGGSRRKANVAQCTLLRILKIQTVYPG